MFVFYIFTLQKFYKIDKLPTKKLIIEAFRLLLIASMTFVVAIFAKRSQVVKVISKLRIIFYFFNMIDFEP